MMEILQRARTRLGMVAGGSILIGLVLFWSVPALGSPEATAVGVKQRTFVSTSGVDTNTCGPTDPCRTFSKAIAETAAGGEVVVLDSGGYGTITIDKSISITARGIYAGITATSGTAVRITIGVSDKVFLRGLTIKGAGGENGIWATGGGQVSIADCVVSNFIAYGANGGINYQGAGTLFVEDTVVEGNDGGGIRVYGVDATTRAYATLTRVIVKANGAGYGHQHHTGILAGSYSTVAVYDSVATRNFRGMSAGVGGSVLSVEASVASQNVVGLAALGMGASLRVATSAITDNTLFGMEAGAGATLASRGNNTVIGNAGGEAFTGTFTAK